MPGLTEVPEQRAYMDALMTEQEAACFLNMPENHLEHLRLRHKAPRHQESPDQSVMYRRGDLFCWYRENHPKQRKRRK